MAKNFKISIGRGINCIHLKLNGHFDGSSAYELLYLLQKLGKSNAKFYIHTDRLKYIYPFGRNIFKNNLHLLAGECIDIVFTGENAKEILAERGRNFEGISLSTI